MLGEILGTRKRSQQFSQSCEGLIFFNLEELKVTLLFKKISLHTLTSTLSPSPFP